MLSCGGFFFISVGPIAYFSMGRCFLGHFLLCLKFMGRDSVVFLLFYGSILPGCVISSMRMFLHDFYHALITRILTARLFLRFHPSHFCLYCSGRINFPLFVSLFTSVSYSHLWVLRFSFLHFFSFHFISFLFISPLLFPSQTNKLIYKKTHR